MSFLIHGKHICLKAASEEDFDFFYHVRSQIQLAPLWQNHRMMPDKEEYFAFLKNVSHNLFIILKPIEKGFEPIGFLYDYDYNAEDGYSFISSAMLKVEMGKELGAEANWLFLFWLFETYPLRKICAEVYEYNQRSLSTIKKAGFQEEGCFLKHRYWQGRYWNIYRLSIFREDWATRKERYHRFFGCAS